MKKTPIAAAIAAANEPPKLSAFDYLWQIVTCYVQRIDEPARAPTLEQGRVALTMISNELEQLRGKVAELEAAAKAKPAGRKR